MNASNRIVFNTLVTYTRAFLTVFITLYSTKLIVKALGVEDFGLYSLVGGVVSLLAFFKSALTASTQRYISVNIGKGLVSKVKKIVANSIIIHFTIGLIIVIGAEIIGSHMLNTKLIIPDNRLSSVYVVFHFVIASTFITIISVPAEAILYAHENMLFLAILGIVEVLLKLIIAITIFNLEQFDKLEFYSLFLFLVLFVVNLIKWIYCIIKYEETKISFKRDFSGSQIKEHTGFVGWNLFGAACSMGRGHGIAIVSNMFFGPVVNAAFGVANQVKSQSSFFSTTVLRVLNPQIMKSEGANDRSRMISLSLVACKFGYFLLAFFVIPLIFEMKTIITLWLGSPPRYTIVFCQLMLIGALIQQLTIGLISAVQAVGDIKKYQILVGSTILLNVPITYILLKKGYSAEIALIVYISIEIIAGFLRLKLCKSIVGLSFTSYFKKVLLKIVTPTLGASLTSYFIVCTFFFDYRFIFTIMGSIIVFFLIVISLGLEKNELLFLKKLLKKAKNIFISIIN